MPGRRVGGEGGGSGEREEVVIVNKLEMLELGDKVERRSETKQ